MKRELITTIQAQSQSCRPNRYGRVGQWKQYRRPYFDGKRLTLNSSPSRKNAKDFKVEGCADRLGSERCANLYQENKCKGPTEDKMFYYCKKTCNKCSLIEEKPQKPSKPPKNQGCFDRLGSERCVKYTNNGKDCEDPSLESRMSYGCKKTCNKCSLIEGRPQKLSKPAKNQGCSDRLGSERCVTYTNNGNRCNGIYEKRMTFNCKKTCKKCLGKYKVCNITKYLNAVL